MKVIIDGVEQGGGGAVDSVNTQTGVVVLDQDDIADGATYVQFSSTQETKLAGIEAGAEVNNISDANATDLTDGGTTTLHTHSGGGGTWGSITGTLSSQTDLQTAIDGKVDENSSITGATKTKVTYDAKGLVTAGADATTADIADSSNKRYITDAQQTVLSNTSGTNTGDQDLSGKKTDSMSTNKLLGRGTAGTGAIEEITLGTNLSLTGTTLNATGGSSSTGVWFVVSGTGAPSSGVGATGDFAVNDNSQVYEKTGAGWVISSRMTRYVAGLVTNGWSASGVGCVAAPATSTSAWTKTNLAAQSGSAINFAGSSADAIAKLSLPPQARAVNAVFGVTTLPTGAPISMGVGVVPQSVIPGTAPWPSITIAPTTGIVTVNTGNGITIKTLSGTAATSDNFIMSLRPGAVLIAWTDSAFALKDQMLYASSFVTLNNLQTYGAAVWFFSTGTATAGNLNYNGGLEVLI